MLCIGVTDEWAIREKKLSNKAKSFSNSENEKSTRKNKKNKSQTYLARRFSLYPQLMLILPSFSLSKTLTPEEHIEESDRNWNIRNTA